MSEAFSSVPRRFKISVSIFEVAHSGKMAFTFVTSNSSIGSFYFSIQ